MWGDASFQSGNLIESGSGNFTVATQSQTALTDIPCTSSMTIAEAPGPTPPGCVKPVANFIGTPTSGNSPLSVQFTDQSASSGCPILSWSWSFDPGSSNQQNPAHNFIYAGNGQSTKFKITLTVTNAAGSDVESKNNYIEAVKP